MAGRYRVSRTLFAYVFAEMFFSFFVSFLFFFFIFFVNQILLMAEEILAKRVPPGQVVLLIIYSLPAIIAMAAPFACLVGTLMGIGRLVSDNEIMVMRSSGLPYPSIFLPVALIGIIISLISFFANDVLLPAGTLEFGKLYRKLLFSTPAIELESNSIKRFKDTVLITGLVEGDSIDQIMILDKTSAGERRLIVAGTAKLEEAPYAALALEIGDAFIHTTTESARDDYDYALAETLRYTISKQDFIQSLTNPGPREMSSRDVKLDIDKKRAVLAVKLEDRTRRAFEAGLDLQNILEAGPDGPSWNGRSSAQARLAQETASLRDTVKDRTLRIYLLEYYKKFSIPFGAFSFIFLAVPLGLFARKSGQSVGFGLGLFIAVLYWALLIGGQTLGLRLNYSPFIAMWLPNIAVIVLGLALSLVRVAS